MWLNKFRPRGNISIYDSFTTVIYTFKVSKHIIIGQSTNINVFSWLLFFFKWERERGWYIKFGYKGEMSPKLLILFFDGVPLENLSRANRLCSIFLHWLDQPGVPLVSEILLSSPLALVICPLRTLLNNFSYYLLPLRGRGHFRFVPANHLASLFSPLCPAIQVTKYQQVLITICTQVFQSICTQVFQSNSDNLYTSVPIQFG